MKTMKIQSAIMLFVCLLFCNFTLEAKTYDDELYRSSMQKALEKLDKASNINDVADARNLFERISGKYQAKWQPVYYVAYCDIQMIYYDSKSEQNKARLTEAKVEIEKLETFADVDMSEVNTLWGYYYNAEILLNPESAKTLYIKVISSYEQAMAGNSNNPRPVILRAFFNQHLPEFIKLKMDTAAEVEKAKQLFSKEEKGIDNPYWGEYFIQMVKIN